MDRHPRALALAALVAERDRERLGGEFSEDIRLRAMLPGGPIEEHGRETVSKCFADWFGEYTTVVLDDAAGEMVGDRLLVHYRLIFEPDTEERTVVTQTWVGTVAPDQTLGRIDLVCSGFRKF
jgi:hypothetical protein